ncbi:MAG: VOC family protein [Planctomycetes bacterium]|nr:VOC family protein [Planctomycetota bacterium]
MSMRIVQFAVTVRDYDEAIAFFVGKVGFRLLEDTDLGGGKRWVRVGPVDGAVGGGGGSGSGGGSGASILLARAAKPEQAASVGNQTGGRVFVFIHTDDFWGDYRAMQSRGVVFVRPPAKETWGTVAVFQDLYGNLYDLIERRRAAPDDGAPDEC